MADDHGTDGRLAVKAAENMGHGEPADGAVEAAAKAPPRTGRGARSSNLARRAMFLVELARTGNAQAAAETAGLSDSGLYQYRRRNPDFAAKWRQAMEDAYEAIESELMAHAGAGQTAAAFNPGLALSMLKMRNGIGHERKRAGLARVTHRPIEAVTAELLRRVGTIERRLAKEGGASAPKAVRDGG